MDEKDKPVVVANPDYIERTAEQWINYQIGNLEVERQYLTFIVDDDPDQEKACLDVWHQKAEPEITLSTTYTLKAKDEAIFITYPLMPQQEPKDVPVNLANGRHVTVNRRNGEERKALTLVAEIIVKAKPITLVYETLDGAVGINPQTSEITFDYGFTDDERNTIAARICDRVEKQRLLAID